MSESNQNPEKSLLNADSLRQGLAATLLRFGATTNVLYGCPNPASANWKLVVEFTHVAGLGTVSVWQSGDCDIGFLPEGSREVIWLHGEFESDSEILLFAESSIAPLFGRGFSELCDNQS